MTAMIEMQGITQCFGGLTAVSDVTETVERGAIHGVIGPNGAGKTTLLNILSGLQRPTAGAVVIDGTNVTRWANHKLVNSARLVRTFQTVRLFASMDVRENLLVAARIVGRPAQARAKVDEVISELGLEDVAAELASSLSYGLQRRVELARVMVAEPKVVLLDEPAAGLSPPERRDLAEMLMTMSGRGVTIVLVEHHMDLVHAVCSSCTVLDFGAIISRGTPEEVTHDERVLEAYLGGARHNTADLDLDHLIDEGTGP
jgi:branched-chain amino acid transport system ATP-binding protein